MRLLTAQGFLAPHFKLTEIMVMRRTSEVNVSVSRKDRTKLNSRGKRSMCVLSVCACLCLCVSELTPTLSSKKQTRGSSKISSRTVFGVIIKTHHLKLNPSGFTVFYLGRTICGDPFTPLILSWPSTGVINSCKFASI